MNNLTNSSYWGEKQHNLDIANDEKFKRMTDFEWLPIIEPYLKKFEGKKFIELGCSPGLASAAIGKRVSFDFHGVDFSPESLLYLINLERIGVRNAKLYKTDLMTFKEDYLFDVVASFGLLEHFTDIQLIFKQHDRLLKPGGLCVVVIPNLRKIQYIYHYIFNRDDLLRHNLNAMNPDIFNGLASQHRQKILYLGYVGKLRFWNVELKGIKIARILKRIASKIVREAAFWGGIILPKDHPIYAPWIVYIGKKTLE